MNCKQCLEGLNKPEIPHVSVQYILDYPDEMKHHLIDLIDNFSTQEQVKKLSDWDIVFAFHLLAQLRCKEAFPSIINFMKHPGCIQDIILGDFVTEGMGRFIVSTFNGDIDSIKALVESEDVWEWSRIACITGLLGLVATQQVSRLEVLTYLVSLLKTLVMDHELVSDVVLDSIALLWPNEFYDEVIGYFVQERGIGSIKEHHLKDMMEMGEEKCLQKYIFDYHYHYPIADAVADIKKIGWNSDEIRKENNQFDSGWDIGDITTGHFMCTHDECFADTMTYQVVRGKPKIGRNEKCPCKSDKKYKHCCI